MVSVWVFLLVPSVSQPVYVCRELMEAKLFASLTFLAASFWILCNTYESYCVQLFRTMSVYSSSGRINEKLIV